VRERYGGLWLDHDPDRFEATEESYDPGHDVISKILRRTAEGFFQASFWIDIADTATLAQCARSVRL
jgi:hypothetical protein